jgi:hypothetical protein
MEPKRPHAEVIGEPGLEDMNRKSGPTYAGTQPRSGFEAGVNSGYQTDKLFQGDGNPVWGDAIPILRLATGMIVTYKKADGHRDTQIGRKEIIPINR